MDLTNNPTTIPDTSAPAETIPDAKIKVCVVEDDPLISDMVVTKLAKSGCEPCYIRNGSEAIAKITDIHPDVIVLDLMLPGLTGEEILKTLKSLPELAQIPVIIFSNKNEPGMEEKLISAGASSYFVKALTDLDDFVAEVKRVAG